MRMLTKALVLVLTYREICGLGLIKESPKCLNEN